MSKNGNVPAYTIPSKNSAYIPAMKIEKDAPAPIKTTGKGDLRAK